MYIMVIMGVNSPYSEINSGEFCPKLVGEMELSLQCETSVRRGNRHGNPQQCCGFQKNNEN